ncbi:MAG: hypothetical protein MUC88_01200 [Planctomycetes bacterium]|nr:hypothetical protein [Planctomycetota bacterium]
MTRSTLGIWVCWFGLSLGRWAAAVAVAASGPVPALEPIKTVEIGRNRELVVNGKPFLPIMSWAQPSRMYPKLAGLGFNTFCGTADPNAAQAVGRYAVASFRPHWIGHPYLLAWIHGDEPDMPGPRDPNNPQARRAPRTSPDRLLAVYQKIKEADQARPVFVTFTGGFARETSETDDAARTQLYSEFIQGADVVGFDIYPIYGSGYAGHLNWVGSAVGQLRELGGPRPLYAWIETSKGSKWMTYEKQPDVLPRHTRNEVWQAIINGATAIGYFTHAWVPKPETTFAPTPEMQDELKRLNAQLARLAPAILAGPASVKIEMKLVGEGTELACRFKATESDGATWIFAENNDLGPGAEKAKQFDPIKPRAGRATFTVAGLKAGTRIEVVDENRAVTVEEGTFSDDFAPLIEHIYKVKMR